MDNHLSTQQNRCLYESNAWGNIISYVYTHNDFNRYVCFKWNFNVTVLEFASKWLIGVYQNGLISFPHTNQNKIMYSTGVEIEHCQKKIKSKP